MEDNRFYFCMPRVRYDPEGLEKWKKIFMSKEARVFSKKTVIVHQGEKVNYLYFIISGLVEYTHIYMDGTQELLEILGDGNIFCLQPVFSETFAVGSFIAFEESVISLISVEELNAYIAQDTDLAKELLRESSQIANGLIRQLFSQTTRAEYRIQQMICTLAEYKKRITFLIRILSFLFLRMNWQG